jgi:hypothetical protein
VAARLRFQCEERVRARRARSWDILDLPNEGWRGNAVDKATPDNSTGGALG